MCSLSLATADCNLRTGDTLHNVRTGHALNFRRVGCVNPRRKGGVNSWQQECDKGGVGCNNGDFRESTCMRELVVVLESGEVEFCALLPSLETSPGICCTNFWGFEVCVLDACSSKMLSGEVERTCK